MGQPRKLPISAFPEGDTHCKRTGHSDLNFQTDPTLGLLYLNKRNFGQT